MHLRNRLIAMEQCRKPCIGWLRRWSWWHGCLGHSTTRCHEELRAAGLFVHISAGLAIIALVALRLLWHVGDPPPPPEGTTLGQWVDRAGQLTHYALYVLLFAVPISGIILQFARGDALPVFGWFEIVSPWPEDRAFRRTFKEIHEVLASALLVLAGLHAGAALIHHWILSDRTLLRMLPGVRR